PLTDAAVMLGFLKIADGEAQITPAGRAFAYAEIALQKDLFREAAMEKLLLFRQIRRVLESKSDHAVHEEFFHDLLDEQFSEEETTAQMHTAITWGRYADIFEYDAGTHRLMLPETAEQPASLERVKQ